MATISPPDPGRTTVDLDALRVFVAVAQARSFTAAARRLGQDKSRVSRAVRALEASLRSTLLERTTRAVRLTAEGEELLARVAPALGTLEKAVESVPGRGQVAAGEVVVACPPDIARAVLAPSLAAFRSSFPAVTVRMLLSSERVDLVRDGVDLAVQVGPGAGATCVARKVGDLEAGFFASPAYLARRGVPRTSEQLKDHDGLWPMPARGQKVFSPGGTPPRPAVQAGDFSFLLELARVGAGVALLPTFLAEREVRLGALARVLPEVSLRNAPAFLVSRPVRTLAARVAALREHLLATALRAW